MGGHRRISARQRFANAVFDLVRLFFQRGPKKIRQPQKRMQSRAHHAHLLRVVCGAVLRVVPFFISRARVRGRGAAVRLYRSGHPYYDAHVFSENYLRM